MSRENKDIRQCRGGGKRGPTSYKMQDSNLVFEALDLAKGDVFLDLGCGPGDYSVHAAKQVGSEGFVYAIDRNLEMLKEVERQVWLNGFENLKAVYGDMTEELPFDDSGIDVCLMSTSLHCMNLMQYGADIFDEIRRVLKPTGMVAVLECKKEKADFGPPLHMRISAEEIKDVVELLGFRSVNYVDLGFNYLLCLKKNIINRSLIMKVLNLYGSLNGQTEKVSLEIEKAVVDAGYSVSSVNLKRMIQ